MLEPLPSAMWPQSEMLHGDTTDWARFLEPGEQSFDFQDDSFDLSDLFPGVPGLLQFGCGPSTFDSHSIRDPYERLENLADMDVSRPASPSTAQAKETWFRRDQPLGPGASIVHDQQLMDYLIGLFKDRVAPWFRLFKGQDFQITRSTRKDWYLFMASIGALFCSIHGALDIALFLYHVGRQILLSAVSTTGALPNVTVTADLVYAGLWQTISKFRQ